MGEQLETHDYQLDLTCIYQHHTGGAASLSRDVRHKALPEVSGTVDKEGVVEFELSLSAMDAVSGVIVLGSVPCSAMALVPAVSIDELPGDTSVEFQLGPSDVVLSGVWDNAVVSDPAEFIADVP